MLRYDGYSAYSQRRKGLQRKEQYVPTTLRAAHNPLISCTSSHFRELLTIWVMLEREVGRLTHLGARILWAVQQKQTFIQCVCGWKLGPRCPVTMPDRIQCPSDWSNERAANKQCYKNTNPRLELTPRCLLFLLAVRECSSVHLYHIVMRTISVSAFVLLQCQVDISISHTTAPCTKSWNEYTHMPTEKMYTAHCLIKNRSKLLQYVGVHFGYRKYSLGLTHTVGHTNTQSMCIDYTIKH